MEDKHVFSILVDNEPGVLSRIAGLFSGRGFNIESLCVAETTNPLVSRITLVTTGEPPIIEQIEKQLNKLINVIKVHNLTGTEYVQREMALIKVVATGEHRVEALRMAELMGARVVDVTLESFVFELAQTTDEIDAFIHLMRPLGLAEVTRTGVCAITRGSAATK